ncbi:hypothetical protein BD779DRAFT_1472716 [Infundibulicybe gibba]|nr:hypothetical protein BD779DRAFT_1472716 [Infundibulicybe gibba]
MAPTYPAYELPQHHDPTTYDRDPYNNPLSHPTTTPVFHSKPADGVQEASRTPSPTPSEQKELTTGVFDWKTLSKWRFWIRREWLWRYVALILVLVITALVTIFHQQIVDALTPVTNWLHKIRFGWLVPIAVLFVISFPPLFGHEIVAILCGLVWGLWAGFGIVAAGTFIGEVGNFYAFKYCCGRAAQNMKGQRFPMLASEGVTTAVFSTCGMGIIVFSIAAILSLPKQFVTVYLGVILKETSSGPESAKSKIISASVVVITTIITIAAMWYIFNEMNRVKPQVIYARRKARQAKLLRAGSSPYSQENSSASSTTLSSGADDLNIPLTGQSKQYGILPTNDFGVYAPQPKRAHDTTIISPKFDVYSAEDELESGYHQPAMYGHKLLYHHRALMKLVGI